MERFMVDGNVYEVRLHDPRTGLRLSLAFARLLGPALIAVMADLVPALLTLKSQGPGDNSQQVEAVMAQFQSLDKTALGKAFQAIFADEHAEQLIHEVLRYTTRNRKQLKEPTVFASAYQANYWELYQAVYQVARLNGFIAALGIFGDASSAQAEPSPTPLSELG